MTTLKEKINCCIDIGGSNIRINIHELNGKLILNKKFKTNPVEYWENELNINEILIDYEVQKVSVGMPGPADYEKGIMKNPPNLIGWHNIDVKKSLLKATKAKEIYFENDANLMGLAHHVSMKKDQKDITQFFAISTGIGASLILNNAIYKGFSGLAQSVAHVPINSIHENNHLSRGAVEYFSSGSGILKRAKKHGFRSTKDVFDAYEENENANKIINEAIEGLANLIASTVAFINPSTIIFDGSVARNNKWYIEKAISLAKKRMYLEQSNSFSWNISNLGDDAVLKGALFLLKAKENEI